jgi:hypothetical protein
MNPIHKGKNQRREKTILLKVHMAPSDYQTIKRLAKERRLNRWAFGGSDVSAVLAHIVRLYRQDYELAPPFLSIEELLSGKQARKARTLAGAKRLIKEGKAKIEEGLQLLEAWSKSFGDQEEETEGGEALQDREVDGVIGGNKPAQGEDQAAGDRKQWSNEGYRQPGKGGEQTPGPGEEGFIHPPFP